MKNKLVEKRSGRTKKKKKMRERGWSGTERQPAKSSTKSRLCQSTTSLSLSPSQKKKDSARALLLLRSPQRAHAHSLDHFATHTLIPSCAHSCHPFACFYSCFRLAANISQIFFRPAVIVLFNSSVHSSKRAHLPLAIIAPLC